MMKWIFVVIAAIMFIVIAGCTHEAPQALAALPTPFISTSASAQVPTSTATTQETVVPTPTISKDCTRSLYAYGGTCTAISRRLLDMMSDCSVYGETSDRCDRTCINYGYFTVKWTVC